MIREQDNVPAPLQEFVKDKCEFENISQSIITVAHAIPFIVYVGTVLVRVSNVGKTAQGFQKRIASGSMAADMCLTGEEVKAIPEGSVLNVEGLTDEGPALLTTQEGKYVATLQKAQGTSLLTEMKQYDLKAAGKQTVKPSLKGEFIMILF